MFLPVGGDTGGDHRFTSRLVARRAGKKKHLPDRVI
jgi:hypothetical protein